MTNNDKLFKLREDMQSFVKLSKQYEILFESLVHIQTCMNNDESETAAFVSDKISDTLNSLWAIR